MEKSNPNVSKRIIIIRRHNKVPQTLWEHVLVLSNYFTQIIHINLLKEIPALYWGGNGVGDRWANKKFNYTVIYSTGKTKTYSENDKDFLSHDLLQTFLQNKGVEKQNGIIGIYIHSKRTKILTRPISREIHQQIVCQSCVACGNKTDIVCDHKNDLYNDPRVLNTKTQILTDFQPLCNRCNLIKRQINQVEFQHQKLYSAKQLATLRQFLCEFPWEKKVFDPCDPECKTDTYWYDPVEFHRKIHLYLQTTWPLVREIKHKWG